MLRRAGHSDQAKFNGLAVHRMGCSGVFYPLVGN